MSAESERQRSLAAQDRRAAQRARMMASVNGGRSAVFRMQAERYEGCAAMHDDAADLLEQAEQRPTGSPDD